LSELSPLFPNQLDLAQTATRTTLDTTLACVDALTTKMEQDYGGDTEHDDGDRRGRARRVVRHPPNDLFSKIKFKIPPFNVILLHILIGS
jgi:hypothetical protein